MQVPCTYAYMCMAHTVSVLIPLSHAIRIALTHTHMHTHTYTQVNTVCASSTSTIHIHIHVHMRIHTCIHTHTHTGKYGLRIFDEYLPQSPSVFRDVFSWHNGKAGVTATVIERVAFVGMVVVHNGDSMFESRQTSDNTWDTAYIRDSLFVDYTGLPVAKSYAAGTFLCVYVFEEYVCMFLSLSLERVFMYLSMNFCVHVYVFEEYVCAFVSLEHVCTMLCFSA